MIDIGIYFVNDTQFSVSNKLEGISVVGRITQAEFEKLVKIYLIDILEIIDKLNKK